MCWIQLLYVLHAGTCGISACVYELTKNRMHKICLISSIKMASSQGLKCFEGQKVRYFTINGLTLPALNLPNMPRQELNVLLSLIFAMMVDDEIDGT
jgi:hypothetical protein